MSRVWLHGDRPFKNSSSQHPVSIPVPHGAAQVDGDVHPGTASPAVVPGWATTVTVAGTLPPDIPATVAPRQSYVGVYVHPAPDDTKVTVHPPTTGRRGTGEPRRVVAIRVGDSVTVQFKTPADAYEWLWTCQQAIDEEVGDVR